MALNELKNTTKNLPEDLETAINSQVEYYKLFIFRVLAKSAMGMVTLFIMGLLALTIVFFLAVAGAFALGKWLGNDAWGFLIVAVLMFIIGLVIHFWRASIIGKPLLKRLSDIYFKND